MARVKLDALHLRIRLIPLNLHRGSAVLVLKCARNRRVDGVVGGQRCVGTRAAQTLSGSGYLGLACCVSKGAPPAYF